ncbi:MAG: Rpn family recombination-promoting nuclease/putative transposase [Lachnospiraceae bacterium]|nr:Rpn family recombination-promoting nuclease/putative transposase [Lachnospiraceae bacterium]
MKKTLWWEKRKVHRQVKDRLFRFIFEKDREALLQLYNALNGTDYQDASRLEVVTIESAVYISMKNDIAFMITGAISLYEHQSTWNPNMPIRFFIYLAEEYQKFIELAEESLYGAQQILLPTPQCVVFYNGEKSMPEEQMLKLSDAFTNKTVKADVELQVRVININYGYNENLMEKCRVLKEYACFVEISRQYTASGASAQEALNAAIEYCIGHNILRDFLKKYQTEVLGMLLEEFDKKKYERTIRNEGREEGRQQQKEEFVRQLFSKGLTAEDIAGLLDMPMEQIEHALH